MNYENLEKNLISLLKEEQLKLGYAEETVRFYYPLSSLKRILGTEAGAEEMDAILSDVSGRFGGRLGKIAVTRKEERYCFAVPPAGGKYVHENVEDPFLADFIRVIGRHGCSLSEIQDVFRKYSDRVIVEQPETEEFDYLIFFAGGVPDEWLYCIKDEGIEFIYHRFLREDYEEMYL